MVIQSNPKDPLPKHGPEAQRELFERFGRMADGFPTEAVIGASINMLLNAIRKTYGTRSSAEQRFDELFGKFKALLLSHYDSVSGRRKAIFPFDQTIEMGHFMDREGYKRRN